MVKYWTAILLAFFAAAYVPVESQDCTRTGSRADSCIDIVRSVLGEDNTKEEMCTLLQSSIDCLRDAIDECGKYYRHTEVMLDLRDMETALRYNCMGDQQEQGSYNSPKTFFFYSIRSCTENRAEVCRNMLMEMDLEEISGKEACTIRQSVADCYRNAIDRCLGRNLGVESDLEETEEHLRRYCRPKPEEEAYFFYEGEDCTKGKSDACMNNLLSTTISWRKNTLLEEKCSVYRSAVDCFIASADQCPGKEQHPVVRMELVELEKILDYNCKEENPDDGELEEINRCFKKNEDYLFECFDHMADEALSSLREDGTLDEITVQCISYARMANCVMDRLLVTCGEAAAKVAKEAIVSNLPEEMEEACEPAGGITNLFNFIDDERKK